MPTYLNSKIADGSSCLISACSSQLLELFDQIKAADTSTVPPCSQHDYKSPKVSHTEYTPFLLSRPPTRMQAWKPNENRRSPCPSSPVVPHQDLVSLRVSSPVITYPDLPGNVTTIPTEVSWDEWVSDDCYNLVLTREACDEQSASAEDHVNKLTADSNFAWDTSDEDNRASSCISLHDNRVAGLVETANSAEVFSTSASNQDDPLAMDSCCLNSNMTCAPSLAEAEQQFLAKRECDGCHHSMEGPKLKQFTTRVTTRDNLFLVPLWCHPREECWLSCMNVVKNNPSMQAELSQLPGSIPSSFRLDKNDYAHEQNQQWMQSMSRQKWRDASMKKSCRISSHVLCPCAGCEKVIYWHKQINGTLGKRPTVNKPTRDADMHCSLECSSKATHHSDIHEWAGFQRTAAIERKSSKRKDQRVGKRTKRSRRTG